MNKLYVFAVFSFLFLSVSCTKDDTSYGKNENSTYEYVTFSAGILSSRATAENFEVLDGIGIYAVEFQNEDSGLAAKGNLVDNREYIYDDQGTFSSVQPIRSDPSKGYNYYAYYPYSDKHMNATEIEFSVSSDQSTHEEFTKSDFLYAKLSENIGATANMQFSHKMSRLKFNLTLENSVDEISDVKMTLMNLCSSAKINLNNCLITLSQDNKQTITPKISAVFPTTIIVAEAIIVPQTIALGQTLFSVTVGSTTYVYKPTEDVVCTSGYTREFNVTLSGGSTLDVIVLPEMKTYLQAGVATLHLINVANLSKLSINVNVEPGASDTKINLLDALATGNYIIESVAYPEGDLFPLETTIAFTAGTETTTEKWSDMLECFGEGTASKPYLFSRNTQLRKLAAAVNNANDFSGKSIVVTNKVNLATAEDWVPIGNKDNPFKGNFDGGNFEISGLRILAAGKSHYLGLFGYVDGVSPSNVSILKNIKLVSSALVGEYDISLSAGRESFYTGSVAGCVKDNAIIENCVSSLKILGNSAVGGIVGGTGYDLPQVVGAFGSGSSYANVTVKNCHYFGEMMLQGGWIPNPGQGAAGMSGGIVGRNHGVVERCSNSANFMAVSTYEWGYELLGGVVGGNGGTVRECFNTGDFAAIPNGTAKDSGISCGGIVGQGLLSGVTGVMLKSYISDCYNTGNIKYDGTSCGGIIGRTSGNAQVGAVIDRCYNVGQVLAKSGGVLGNYNVAAGMFDIQFCVTNNTKTNGNAITNWTLFTKGVRNPSLAVGTGRMKPSNAVDMMKQETYTQQAGATGINWNWDFTNVWQIEEGSSYPYLKNNAPKVKTAF